jgi:hypothetical protein
MLPLFDTTSAGDCCRVSKETYEGERANYRKVATDIPHQLTADIKFRHDHGIANRLVPLISSMYSVARFLGLRDFWCPWDVHLDYRQTLDRFASILVEFDIIAAPSAPRPKHKYEFVLAPVEREPMPGFMGRRYTDNSPS